MSNIVQLTRFGDTPFGVFGQLVFPDGVSLYTVERPWISNQSNVSCIPTGIYTLSKRVSPKVSRIVKDRYPEAWEVTKVPGRTFIMIHPANRAKELEGCIAVGLSLDCIAGDWAVMDSQKAYDLFMNEMNKLQGEFGEDPQLVVNWKNFGAY